MKNIGLRGKLFVCGTLGAALCLAIQAEILVGPGNVVVTNIATDAVQTERVLTYGGGCLMKTGGAKLSLPVGVIEDTTPFAATVVSGKVDIVTTAVSLGVPTLPASITDKAKMWFDASLYDTKPYLFAGSTMDGHTYVDQWYDVRETPESVVSTPLRPYCQAWDRRPSDSKAYYDATRTDGLTAVRSPEIVSTNGIRALWFGGVTSGRNYMWTKPTGGFEDARNIRSVFVVHGVFESVGNLLGVALYGNTWLLTGACDGTTGWQNVALVQNPSILVGAGGQLYRNGEQLDFSTAVTATQGFQLFEATSAKAFAACSFFNERYHCCNEGPGNRNGGDFICEALVFNQELTADERAQVTAYLMAKWNLKSGMAKSLTVAKAGELMLDADAGGQVATNLALAGSGTLRKTGATTLANGSVGHDAFTGALALEDGALVARRQWALDVADGTTVSAAAVEAGAAGSSLSLSAAVAGSLVKTGKSDAVVTGVPSTVTRIDVQEGMLKVRPTKQRELVDERLERRAYADNDIVYSCGFEGWEKEYTTGYWDDGWSWTAERCGWKYCSMPLNADGTLAGGNYIHVINGHWKDENGNPKDPSGWGFPYNSTGDGDGYIAWRWAPALVTEVTFPEAGAYEVSFALAARNNQGSRPVFVELIATDLSWTNTFHTSYIPATAQGYKGGFFHDKAKFTVATAGAYYLGFRNTTGGDTSTCLDAVTVRRVRPSCASLSQTGWLVPGGDFDYHFVTNDVDAYRAPEKVATNQHGWDFSTPCTYTNPNLLYRNWTWSWATVSTAAVITRDNDDILWNSCTLPVGCNDPENYAQVLFPGDGAAVVTTFTPPKGVWRVAADMAGLSTPDYSNNTHLKHKFVATVKRGAADVVPIGEIKLANVGFRSQAFPALIDADGVTPWTLTIAFDTSETTGNGSMYSAAALDNVRLVNVVGEGGALADPSFEGDGWTLSGSFASSDSSGTGFTSRGEIVNSTSWSWTANYGTDVYPDGGTRMVCLAGRGFVSQRIGLLAGRYRLSFYSRSRCQTANPDWYSIWGCNPLEAYLAQDGVTNVITVAACSETNFVEHVAEFQVLADGIYDFGFRGLSGSSALYPLRVNNAGAESLLDSVSILPIADPIEVAFGTNPDVTVAAGARLELDFNGTNVVNTVRLGGRKASGVIDRTTFPDYISGTGALFTKPKGMLLMVR